MGAPLLGAAAGAEQAFNYGPRSRNDVGWLLAYLGLLALSAAGGIYGYIAR